VLGHVADAAGGATLGSCVPRRVDACSRIWVASINRAGVVVVAVYVCTRILPCRVDDAVRGIRVGLLRWIRADIQEYRRTGRRKISEIDAARDDSVLGFAVSALAFVGIPLEWVRRRRAYQLTKRVKTRYLHTIGTTLRRIVGTGVQSRRLCCLSRRIPTDGHAEGKICVEISIGVKERTGVTSVPTRDTTVIPVPLYAEVKAIGNGTGRCVCPRVVASEP
jgi:hypothetical protein